MKLEDRIAYLEERAQYFWDHLTARSQDEDTQSLYLALWEDTVKEIENAEQDLAWEECWAYEN